MKKKLNACYCRRQWPKKMLRVMKIGFFLLVLGLTSVHATTFSQQKVNLNVKNVTLLHVLDLLQEQSEFSFLFSSEDVKNVTNLSVKAKNEDLFEVLRRCLQGTALSFEVNGDLVVLKLQAKTGEPEKKTLKVKGFVFDAKKLSMPGVTVKVVGTSIGTVTDARGWFQILLPMTHGKLEFSFVGYKSKQVDFTEKVDTLRVMLEENIEELEGVVVTGMFTRKAESFTGSASTFKREDILRAGNQNLIKSLKNLDPAFQISENLEFGSDPNRMPDVQLRGQTSFANVRGDYEGNPNQPLFILDGFETTIEKVFDLDMNRVASVTLLKDAAAKAIYGSKAGNGVVVIETVRPKSGELRVYYSGDFGIEAPDLTSYDLMNAEEKLAYEVKIGMYSPDTHPGIITAHQSYKKVYDDVQRGVNTYWLSKPLHVGFSNKHSLTLEGGDEQMRYQFGVSYNSVSGVMKESGRNTLNANTTLSYTYRNLLFRNTIEFTRNWSKNSPYGSFAEYTSLNPYWAPYDDEGNLNRVFLVHSGKDDNTSYSDIEVYNPLYNATLNTKDESNYTEIRDNFSMDWNISGALRVVGGFSYSRQENGADIYYPKNHTKFIHYDENGMSDRKGQYTKKDGYSENIAVQAGLNFNKTLGEHLFFANLTWRIVAPRARWAKDLEMIVWTIFLLPRSMRKMENQPGIMGKRGKLESLER